MNVISTYGFVTGKGTAVIVIALVSLILSLILGIGAYFIFLSKKNEGKYTGFLGWLYDFLSFKKLMIEALLKILYLIFACYMTIDGFLNLFISFGAGLAMLTVGNIAVRLAYEFSLMLVMICKNTSDIRAKLNGEKSGSSMFAESVELPKKEEKEETK